MGVRQQVLHPPLHPQQGRHPVWHVRPMGPFGVPVPAGYYDMHHCAGNHMTEEYKFEVAFAMTLGVRKE